MTGHLFSLAAVAAVASALALAGAGDAAAQSTPAGQGAQAAKPAAQATGQAAKPAPQAAAKRKAPAAAPVEAPIASADDTQMAAARHVFTGASGCEFNQAIDLQPSAKHPGYVDLRHGARTYLMKPIVSPTGAVRLEDVRQETLLIQIGSKSMLMNQKTGQRLVDNCIHPTHQVARSN